MSEETRQARYYTVTADGYDEAHSAENDEHNSALRIVAAISRQLGLRTGLDVGAGTGRAIRFLEAEAPDLEIRGIEPVQALIEVALTRHGLAEGRIVAGSGLDLPFSDDSFDFVIAQAVLHHVRTPERVVSEMLRVARRGIFVVDSNRFGYGSAAGRLTKLALAKAGLWRVADLAKTRGRGYRISDGDGLAYSYSVYDSLALLEDWGDEVQLLSATPMGLQGHALRAFQPLLTSRTVLMYALRHEAGRV